MEKIAIRKQVIETLTSLTSEEKRRIEASFYEALFSSSIWENAQSIGVTLSSGFEWNTEPIIRQAWLEGKKVGVPKSIHATRELHFYQIEQFNQVKSGYFGIREPIPEQTTRLDANEIDLMIVPGVVYTETGYRIGFGGGYYDRLLTDYPHSTISLVHFNQLVKEMPIENHDIPVKYMITLKDTPKSKNHAIIKSIQE
ncbi:5-formyltetrahydrofolate cyclo-ligase [Marinilactibacillus sp. GCM10026970]|uniref:5-formyltetrahydrofolate cyclo-ligase n=1 Tax=Marinilactibacillus sp. GCM10026970 TaxID=3252642 RepID=UPI003612ECC7